MHARLDELLSARAGELLAVTTRQHIEQCATCTAAIAQLARRSQSLRELPQLAAPQIDFTEIAARANDRLAAPAEPATRWRALAAVIVCALVAGGVVLERGRLTATTVVGATSPAGEQATSMTDASLMPVAQLVAESRVLDELLQRLPPPPEVQRVSLAGSVDRIEQRVQWIDMQLSSVTDTAVADTGTNELARQLWRERVGLMDSLVKVRYAEAVAY